jgi:hypothetical protein
MTARVKEIELPRFESELIAVSVVFRDDESATVASVEVIVLLPNKDMMISTIRERATTEAKRFLLECQNAELLDVTLTNGGADSLDNDVR